MVKSAIARLFLESLLISLITVAVVLRVGNTDTARTIGRDIFAQAPAVSNVPNYTSIRANLKMIFTKGITVQNGMNVSGDIEAPGSNLNLGSGNITAANIIYSLTAGDGVSITGNKQSPTIGISNVGSIAVSSIEEIRGDVDLVAGDNVTISKDGNKITIKSSYVDTNTAISESDVEGYIYDGEDSALFADLDVGNGTFVVGTDGNLSKIKGVSYVWPSSQGGAGTFLQNDGSGGLSWVTNSFSITADSLDFSDFADNMTLDDTTSVAMGGYNFGFTGTGVTNVFSIGSGGVITVGDIPPAGYGTGTFRVAGAKTATAPQLVVIDSATTQAADVGGSLGLAGYNGSYMITYGSVSGLKENGTAGTTNGYLSFATRPGSGSLSEKMRISSSGNVGIGTTSPRGKLDIDDGNIYWGTDDTTGTTRYLYGADASGYDRPYLSFRSANNGNTVTLGSSSSGQSGGYLQFGANLSESTLQGYYAWHIQSSAPGSYMRFSTGGNNERMRIDSSGNIGIAVTTPLAKLDVAGTSWLRGSTASSGGLYVNSSGNVGIGTTSPASKLEVVRNAAGGTGLTISSSGTESYSGYSLDITSSSSTNVARLGQMAYFNNGNIVFGLNASNPTTNKTLNSASTFVNYEASGDKIPLAIYGKNYTTDAARTVPYFGITSSALNASSPTADIFVINQSGNVGIGSTSPTSKLHIVGDMRLTGAFYDSTNSAGTSGLLLTSTGVGTTWSSISGALGGSVFLNDGNAFGGLATLGTTDANALRFITAGTEAMRILANGNVGIGTTSPTRKLSVFNDDGVGLGEHHVMSFGRDTNNEGVIFGYRGNGSAVSGNYLRGTASLPLYLGTTGDTQAVTILNSGSVGIGTTSPLATLDVAGTSWLRGSTAASGGLYVNGSGNVGIGTTSPGYKLDVSQATAGTIARFTNLANSISGEIYVGSSAVQLSAGSGGIEVYPSADGYLSVGNNRTTIGSSDGIQGSTSYGGLKIKPDGSGAVGNTVALQGYNGSSWQNVLTLPNVSSGNVNLLLSNNGGNVGIGTTSPSSKLQITDGSDSLKFLSGNRGIAYEWGGGERWRMSSPGSGIIHTGLFIYGNEAGVGTPLNGSNVLNFMTGGAERMRINSSGNVGIGTTSPAYKLDVVANTYADGIRFKSYTDNATPGPNVMIGGYNGGDQWAYLGLGSEYYSSGKFTASTSNPTLFGLHGSQTTLFADSGITVGETYNPTARITILNTSGNVGIGATNPGSLLTLGSGDIRWGSDLGGNIGASGNSGRPGYIYAGSLIVGSPSASGFCGGTCQSTFGGSVAATGGLWYGSNSYIDESNGLRIHGDSSHPIKFMNGASTEVARIDVNSGNVGIGTTAPGAKLEVVGEVLLPSTAGIQFGSTYGTGSLAFRNGATTLASLSSTTGITSNLNFKAGYGIVSNPAYGFSDEASVGIYKPSSNKLSLVTNNTDRLVVDSSGNVGIGTTGPNAKLEVLGNADVKQVVVKANASQTASIQEWQNSSGTLLSRIDSSGSLVIKNGGNGSTTLSVNSLTAGDFNYAGFSLDLNAGNYSLKPTYGGYFRIVNTQANTDTFKVITRYDGYGAANLITGLGSFIQTADQTTEVALILKGASGQIANLQEWRNNSNTALTVVNASGSLGIGTTAPSFPLDVSSTVSSDQTYGYLNSSGVVGTSSGTNTYSMRAAGRIMAPEFNAVSDARLKDVQYELSPDVALNALLQLQPVSYTWKNNPSGQPILGFLAQDVEKVVPNAVSMISTSNFVDQRELNYNQLIAVAIGAIKKQEQKIQQQGEILKGIQNDNGVVETSRRDVSTEQYDDKIASIEATLASLKTDMEIVKGNSYTASISAFLAANSGSVLGASDSASLSDLIVSGDTNVYDLAVAGDISTGLLKIQGLACDTDIVSPLAGDTCASDISTLGGPLVLQGQAQEELQIMAGKVVVDTSGNIHSTGEITVKKVNIDTSDTAAAAAGKSTLEAGKSEITIPTTAVSADSLIQVTFRGNYAPATRYWIESQKRGESFTLKLDQAVQKNTDFSWMIVN